MDKSLSETLKDAQSTNMNISVETKQNRKIHGKITGVFTDEAVAISRDGNTVIVMFSAIETVSLF